MAHLARILTDASLRRGRALTGQEVADIDENTLKAVNGDEGGDWAPSAAVEIAGEGAVVAGPWTMSGAGVTVQATESKPITFGQGGSGDYFGLASGHAGAAPNVFFSFIRHYNAQPFQVGWTTDGVVSKVTGASFYIPLSVYSGAPQIDSIEVKFYVGTSHPNVPQYLPKMRIVSVDEEGVVTPLRAKDATTDADGFQYFTPAPATGAAWYNGGATKTWTYTCNVVQAVDSSARRYFVEIVDESGWNAIATNVYVSANVKFSAVPLFDGRN